MGRFSPIAEGGYAQVHYTNYNGQECVRKVLRDELTRDITVFKRFQREYNVLKDIDHPNIIKVFDVDGASYIMEKAETSLEDYVLDNLLSELDMDSIIDGILAGIACLHEKRIIHRDLKPDNILLVNGIPKIADLGVCKKLDSNSILTKSGREYLGTYGYMSQNQLNGLEPTFHFDIFAIGRIIYFLETKSHPPIGRLRNIPDIRYKPLIMVTELEDPVQIDNIDKFKEILNRTLANSHLSSETAVGKLIQGEIKLSEMVAVIENSSLKNFGLINDNFEAILASIPNNDNASIELLMRIYLKEFEIFKDQRYWPFDITFDVTSNLLKMHDKINEDSLKNELFFNAFLHSYDCNQFKAMGALDRFVRRKGNSFYRTCMQSLSARGVNDSLLSQFAENNG